LKIDVVNGGIAWHYQWAIEDRKTWATIRKTKEEKNAQGEETAKWTMTAQHTNRSSPIQEATTPTNVAAGIHSLKNLWTSKCLVICKSTGKDVTLELYAVQSSHDSQKTSWRNTTNTWITLSRIWRRKSKDKIHTR
jgi:hypothetical protein